MQVVVSPNDCGKTRMLKRLQEIWAFGAEETELEDSWGCCTSHLLETFRGWAERFGGWSTSLGHAVSLKIPGVEVKLVDSIMDAFLKGVESHSDLGAVTMRFVDVIDANPTALPIFILDEAN